MITWLSKTLNPRNWLKPVLLILARLAVKRVAGQLAKKIKHEISSKKSKEGFDRAFDRAQESFYLASAKTCGKLPALCGLTDRLNHIVKEQGDAIQKEIKQTILKEGPGAIDGAFERWRDATIEKINAL